MMVSPEWFYEDRLKGKTAEQVTDVSIDLDPEWPNERFYQKEIKKLEENG